MSSLNNSSKGPLTWIPTRKSCNSEVNFQIRVIAYLGFEKRLKTWKNPIFMHCPCKWTFQNKPWKPKLLVLQQFIFKFMITLIGFQLLNVPLMLLQCLCALHSPPPVSGSSPCDDKQCGNNDFVVSSLGGKRNQQVLPRV